MGNWECGMRNAECRMKKAPFYSALTPHSALRTPHSVRGVALLLTVALTLLFMILVAGFYQTVIGRQRWTHKRVGRSTGWYKAEAGTQDALARLRLGRRGSAVAPAGPAIDSVAGLHYCLDLSTSTILASNPPGGGDPACPLPGTNNVLVRVAAQDANGLNKIDVLTTY